MKFKIAMEDVKKLTLAEIAVLSQLRKYTNADNTTLFRQTRLIAETIKMSERAVQTIIAKLKKAKIFTVDNYIEHFNGQTIKKNSYTFAPLKEMFVLVDNSIFESDLEAKEIGLLIRLKVLTLNNSNTILKSKEWIAKSCGVTYTAFNKLFKSLEAKGFIKYETSKLTLTNNFFHDNSTFGRRNRSTKERRAKVLEMYKYQASLEIKKGSYKGKMLIKYLPKANYPVAALKGIIRMHTKPQKELHYTNLILF